MSQTPKYPGPSSPQHTSSVTLLTGAGVASMGLIIGAVIGVFVLGQPTQADESSPAQQKVAALEQEVADLKEQVADATRARSVAEQLREAKMQLDQCEASRARDTSACGVAQQKKSRCNTPEQTREPVGPRGIVRVVMIPGATKIWVDGKRYGEKSPRTLRLLEGEHTLQVEFFSGEKSDVKTVDVVEGESISVMFRER